MSSSSISHSGSRASGPPARRPPRRATLINPIMRLMARLGRGQEQLHTLHVRGRRSGKVRRTPIAVIEAGGHRHIVSALGAVDWVHNARAAGEVDVSRGGTRTTYRVEELSGDAAAQVLQPFLAASADFTQPYFDVRADAPWQDFRPEVAAHPVFRLHPVT